jgi:hypothetical protein
VISVPPPGSCRIVQPFGETVELLHLAADRTAADAWLQAHRYAHARIEKVGIDGEGEAALIEPQVSTVIAREAM